MKTKDILINNLHKIIRKDEFIDAILNPAGLHLDEVKDKMTLLEKEFLFSTMSLERIQELEKELNYKTKSTTIEGKRIEIEARWKTTGKCDLELLQTIANSWRNGEISVKFIDGTIEIVFISIVGIPDNIEVLKAALGEAKPAHLEINFQYRYRLWRDLPPKTWEYYSQFTWEEVMKKEGI